MLIHTLRTYLRRFWPEFTVFWLLSGAASWLAWSDPGAKALAGMALLEALAFLIAALRLMQAENVFATLGGWRVRPLSRNTLRHARWGLFALLLLPAVLMRAGVCAALFSPGSAEWRVIALQVWLPQLIGCVVGAAAAGWVGRDGRFGEAYKTPALIWGVILIVGGSWAGYSLSRSRFWENRSTGSPAPLIRSNASSLKNGVPGEAAMMVPLARLPLARLPLRAGEVQSNGGCLITLAECAQTGGRASVAVDITVPAGALRPWELIRGPNGDTGLRLYIRYGNGSWAPQADRFNFSKASPLPGLGVERFSFGGSFATPLAFPETDKTWDLLAAEAECVVFVDKITGTAHAASTYWPPLPEASRTWDPKAPAPQLSPAATAVKAVMDTITAQRSHGWADAHRLLESTGPDGVPEALRYNWPKHDGGTLLSAFLTKHATEAHLPLLLKELETEPRLTGVFIPKSWQARAIPVLRRQLLDGLPLPTECLTVIASEGDPALAPSLHAAAVRCAWPSPALKEKLQSHPGIDWPRLVHDAWRFHCFSKASPNEDSQNPWLEAAAWTGNKDALRDLAAIWLVKPPPHDAVTQLFAFPKPANEFPVWLRANFDHLQWDSAAARWRLP